MVPRKCVNCQFVTVARGYSLLNCVFPLSKPPLSCAYTLNRLIVSADSWNISVMLDEEQQAQGGKKQNHSS